jgi:hypothetical protein
MAALIFASLFFLPSRYIYEEIFHFAEKPWTVEEHKQGYFLSEALHEKKRLHHYVFCYEGYNGQIAFYIRALQARGDKLRIRGDVRNLSPGDHVVISQKTLEKELISTYSVKMVSQKFGCTVYLVHSRL